MNNFERCLAILQGTHQTLNEMIKVGTECDGNIVIGFDKWIYIFNPDDDDKVLYETILNNILSYFSPVDVIHKVSKKYIDNMTLISLLKIIKEHAFDVFIGFINDNSLVVDTKFHHDPQSSVLLHKIMKQLDVKKLNTVEDLESYGTFDRTEFFKETPNVGFHGTTSDKLVSILKYGLVPSTNLNWITTLKKPILFFSTRKLQPLYHAIRGYNRDKSNLPIIIEFNIPAKQYIVQDYDMEEFAGIADIYDLVSRKTAISNKPLVLSKEFGLYGYTKTIKPNFITGIYVPDKNVVAFSKEHYNGEFKRLDSFIKLNKEDALEYIYEL